MADSVSNFPLDTGTAHERFLRFQPFSSMGDPFITKLIEAGVLPLGVKDFTFEFPLEGVVTIKAEYNVDRNAFEQALREYQCQPADRENRPL